MIGRVEVAYRRLRRLTSRSEWARRLLGLPVQDGAADRPGLVIIQIDGLGHSELLHAIRRRRMPFLHRLLKREHYELRSMYSGLPSTTPAVQAELFYGVKTAIPAFSYYDGTMGRTVRLFEPETAAALEKRLETHGEPLLKGGGAYSDIFTGGAEEAHFCVAHSGWGKKYLRRPFGAVLAALLHLDALVRLAWLIFLEVVLAVWDFFDGMFDGESFGRELRFVPTRVAICLVLRELCTAGVTMDVSRGVPIIHVNFLGYDEQAHRRGPGSRFAHWTLKGIDGSIRKIWKAANRSAYRTYDVWIYSDHGQSETFSIPAKRGHSFTVGLEGAVRQAFGDTAKPVRRVIGAHPHRAKLLGGWLQRFLSLYDEPDVVSDSGNIRVACMGPIGHLYLPKSLGEAERDRFAQTLVSDQKIPLVLASLPGKRARAWTREGVFSLPDDAESIFGADHPFLQDVSADLLRLCHHPSAGSLIISGWNRNGKDVTMATENGSHGGPGPREMHAFALLPVDAPLSQLARQYLRPLDLRNAVLRFTGRLPREKEPRRKSRPVAETFRLMTYNVHRCLGMDGRYSPERIARVIARHAADVVALQELDVRRLRSGRIDQAATIADRLQMLSHFHPSIRLAEEQYGDAILSPHPMRLIRAAYLPHDPAGRGREPRGAIFVTISLERHEVHIINTHLGYFPRERMLQSEALLGRDWLGDPSVKGPVVLCGDFNASPGSPAFRRITQVMRDAQVDLAEHTPHHTWFGRYPLTRIDHVFLGPQIEVLAITVPNSELERVASDHLPLIVDLRVHP